MATITSQVRMDEASLQEDGRARQHLSESLLDDAHLLLPVLPIWCGSWGVSFELAHKLVRL